MVLHNTIRSRYFCALLNIQSPSNCCKRPLLNSLISSDSFGFSFLSLWRSFSHSAQFAKKSEEKSLKCRAPLSVFFKEAVGLWEKSENSAVQAEDGSENTNLKQRLRKLEEEVRNLNRNRREQRRTLKLPARKGELSERSSSALFADKNAADVKSLEPTDFGNEDPKVHEELSSDMQMFTHHLYMKGYLKNANFMRKNRFDLAFFEVSYAREFLKFAAVKIGKDHQEIAKWLSASDLKKVALFGCPSLGKRSVYSAKHIRRFFEIEEHKVCQRCTLKESCKHTNKRLQTDYTRLDLASVIRVLTMYALDSIPQQLVVPEEIKNSVSRLLKEIMNLSQNLS